MKSSIILFTKNGMGQAPEDLSKTLVTNYLNLLKEEKNLPAAILFYGEGAKLVCEDAQIIDSLTQIEKKGVQLIVCKTCLNYFGLADKVKVGQIGTMADILAYQLEAKKVITL